MSKDYYCEMDSTALTMAISRIVEEEVADGERHPLWIERRAHESVADLFDPSAPPPGEEYADLRLAVMVAASLCAEAEGLHFHIAPVN